MLPKCYKIYKDDNEFKTEQTKTQNTKRQKASFAEELVVNADKYKAVLNKIMTTHD